MRERVLAAARELDYAPSGLARALVTKRSRIVGVIVGDVVDPYFAQIARGFEDVAGRAGYLTMVCNAERRTVVEQEYVNVLREYHAEGVVFAASGAVDDPDNAGLRDTVEQAYARGMNVISLAPRDLRGSSVTIDNRAAGYELVDYLVGLGHRNIALVAGPPVIGAVERLDGFHAALRDLGLEAFALYEGDFTLGAGHAAALGLLADPERPDAVACANDATAIGVLTTLRQAGVDVPGAVSVVGIGDTAIADYLELSTVSIPTYELGAVAARRILGDERDEIQIVLPHRLVPRATSAPRSASP
jgi:LacI family transcriptional regulator